MTRYVKLAGYAYIRTYVFFRHGVKAYVKPMAKKPS